MLKHRFSLALFCGLLISLGYSGDLCAQDNAKTVLVHYMPWYASKPISGHWGWHWTMNHFNPDNVKLNGQREVASHDYRYLEYVQEHAATNSPFSSDDLRLPVALYHLKKRHAQELARTKELDRATELLLAGKVNEARSIIEAASKSD